MTKTELIITDIKLPKEIFSVNASDKLLSQYVYVYLNNWKKGFSQTKTRSEVTGSTRKIYRQKGTGRARHGSSKAPIFVGGGVALGPTGDYRQLKLTKKMRRKALFYSLSLKLKNKNLLVIDQKQVEKVKKTKEAASLLEQAKINEKALLVLPHHDGAAQYFYNLNDLKVNEPMALNAYKVLKAKQIVFSDQSLAEFIKLFKHE